MKYNSYNLDSKINQPSFILSNKKLTISEQQILELQDLFLTKGIHTIEVPSIRQGRYLIYSFLDALRCFNSVACITMSKVSLKKNIFNMHEYLHWDNDNFFSHELDFDFIWIEILKDNKHDIMSYQHIIEHLCMDRQIPIIQLTEKKMSDNAYYVKTKTH